MQGSLPGCECPSIESDILTPSRADQKEFRRGTRDPQPIRVWVGRGFEDGDGDTRCLGKIPRGACAAQLTYCNPHRVLGRLTPTRHVGRRPPSPCTMICSSSSRASSRLAQGPSMPVPHRKLCRNSAPSCRLRPKVARTAPTSPTSRRALSPLASRRACRGPAFPPLRILPCIRMWCVTIASLRCLP